MWRGKPFFSVLVADWVFLPVRLTTDVRKRKVLVPIQFIADDSGCKGGSLDAVMGGVFGEAEQWADFSDRWKACWT